MTYEDELGTMAPGLRRERHMLSWREDGSEGLQTHREGWAVVTMGVGQAQSRKCF